MSRTRKPWYRARVLIAGSEIDDPEFTKMCEMAGGLVVADRYCFGSMPGREEIPLEEGKDVLQSIADYYMWRNQCPRAMGPENIIARKKYIFDLVEKYHADGIIVENMKFCEYWGYERAQDGMWLTEGLRAAAQRTGVPDREGLHQRRHRSAAYPVPGVHRVAGDQKRIQAQQ